MHDYIVVGGGSAGCVLAHRLTEDPDIEVLLLEAGKPSEDRDAVKAPMRAPELMGTDIDWDFETEPQPGLNGRQSEWPRGKALGGSSVINAMIYIRGHPWDFDNWAALGNEGWSYDDLLPYFKRSETLDGEGDARYHGTDGPLTVSRGSEHDAFQQRAIDAAVEAGLEWTPDFNGERQAGAGYYHWTIQDGHRHSTAAAFVLPVLDRPNLTVETSAFATQVRFDGDRATGVVYEQDGTRREAQVGGAGEIILSAGAVQSPQLLMVSGIGPADHLDEHDIDVVADVPGVGRTLQDHLRLPVRYEGRGPLDTRRPPEDETRHDPIVAGGFEHVVSGSPAPDIQYVVFTHDQPDDSYAIWVVPLRPESRGRLTLRSADPHDPPVIDPRYLSTQEDVDPFVAGVRGARDIARQAPLAEVTAEEVLPGPDVRTDEKLEAFVRDTAVTSFHPTSTCKMGDDELAVVDDHLRVRGVEGLWVVDASVMPRVTSGNTNAPTIAIAEKGADLILADH